MILDDCIAESKERVVTWCSTVGVLIVGLLDGLGGWLNGFSWVTKWLSG
jgi:hypothetical protein